jgi:signal transduction histidine kinase
VASVQLLGDNFLVHRSLPAWQSNEPVLAIVDKRGRLVHRAFDASDLRAVQVWRSWVLVIEARDQRYRFAVLDSTLKRVSLWNEFPEGLTPAVDRSPRILASDSSAKAFIWSGGALMLPSMRGEGPMQVIEQGVFGAGMGTGAYDVLSVHDVGGIAYASLLDSTMNMRVAPNVPLAPSAEVGMVGGRMVVVSPVDVDGASQVSLIDPATSEVRTLAVPVRASQVVAFEENHEIRLAAVVNRSGRFHVSAEPPDRLLSALSTGVELPSELGMPRAITALGDTLLVLFDGGVATILGSELLSSDPVDVRLGGALAVERRGDVLLISGQNGSVLLDRRSNPFWWVVSAATQSGPYVIPGLLLVAIGILLLRLRRQRRFLDAMLEVPGAGLVFVFDAGGRLLRTNDRSARLLRITAKVPMRRLYRAYMRHNGVDGLQAFITHALDVRRPVSEKITVDDDDEQREYMFTAQPLWGTLGRMRALVVTGIDITEALERRRLVNWAQLAHDMQTNLSTIRLNGEQLTDLMQEADKQRVKRILFQTDVLIQRVRDLVGVGRSEDLQRSQVHSAEFCTQILHEFDAGMFPNVQFVMKLRGTMMNVDKLKLSRAVRNAVENAIKSLRGNQGTVEIATWFDRNNVYIRISDTGVGMDTLTLENMMKPYFTTAKEGSGTGIGTMIMQHVTHMHGGSLRVTSEPGEGTQVVFRIPIGL